MNIKTFKKEMDAVLKAHGWGKLPVMRKQQTQLRAYFASRHRKDCLISLRRDGLHRYVVGVRSAEGVPYYHVFRYNDGEDFSEFQLNSLFWLFVDWEFSNNPI